MLFYAYLSLLTYYVLSCFLTLCKRVIKVFLFMHFCWSMRSHDFFLFFVLSQSSLKEWMVVSRCTFLAPFSDCKRCILCLYLSDLPLAGSTIFPLLYILDTKLQYVFKTHQWSSRPEGVRLYLAVVHHWFLPMHEGHSVALRKWILSAFRFCNNYLLHKRVISSQRNPQPRRSWITPSASYPCTFWAWLTQLPGILVSRPYSFRVFVVPRPTHHGLCSETNHLTACGSTLLLNMIRRHFLKSICRPWHSNRL